MDNTYINDICDLNKNKVCDNCEKCLGTVENDYMEITIDGVIKETDEIYKEYEDFEVFSEEECESEHDELEYEFIEDHEELRAQYYKDLEEILNPDK